MGWNSAGSHCKLLISVLVTLFQFVSLSLSVLFVMFLSLCLCLSHSVFVSLCLSLLIHCVLLKAATPPESGLGSEVPGLLFALPVVLLIQLPFLTRRVRLNPSAGSLVPVWTRLHRVAVFGNCTFTPGWLQEKVVVATAPWNAEGQFILVTSSPFSCSTEPAASEFVVLLGGQAESSQTKGYGSLPAHHSVPFWSYCRQIYPDQFIWGKAVDFSAQVE